MADNDLKYNFNMLCIDKTTKLTDLRKKSNLTQLEMAFRAGASLKSIQRFEGLKSNNPYLIFAYSQILKSHTA